MSTGSDVQTIYKLEIDLTPWMPRQNGYYIDEVQQTADAMIEALKLEGITALHHYTKLPPKLVILFQDHDTALKARFVIVCMDTKSE